MTPEEKSVSYLHWQNVVVFDAETKHLVGEVVDGREVKWTTPELMGASSVVLFDYETGDYHFYLEPDFHRLVDRLNRAELVVGFNQKGFDNGLLRGLGYPLKPEAELVQYDILEEVRKGLGWQPGSRSFPRGCSLDQILIGTFGERYKKNGAALDAPKLYQAGKIGELLTYNCGDVRRTRMVFEHCYAHGWVSTPANGKSAVAHPLKVWRAGKERSGLSQLPQDGTGQGSPQADLFAGAAAGRGASGQPSGGSSENGNSQAGGDVHPGRQGVPGQEGAPEQHHHQASEVAQ